MYQRDGKSAFKKDLNNIKLLCDHFGNPHEYFDTIHIAGTNGKGTVAHMLSAVLQRSGLKVGIYTSPHYIDFRERIKVNGEFIDKRRVSAFTKKVINQTEHIRPSFFEITVAMAFVHFKREKVDIAIIETGLGGRLDSTNIITPKLSIITNISLDHQSMLGNTIKKIAKEKAGIIKKGVPIVIGERQKGSEGVFIKVAAKQSAEITFAEDLKIKNPINQQKTKLLNPYLTINSRTATAAIEVWNKHKLGVYISKDNLQQGLLNFATISKYIGRWQILQEKPLVIADSAHNEGGITLLISRILESYQADRLHFVLGFVKGKPLDRVLKLFPDQSNYYFSQAQLPRALPVKELSVQASKYKLRGNAYHSVMEAKNMAISKAHLDDLVIICGSIFVIGEVI